MENQQIARFFPNLTENIPKFKKKSRKKDGKMLNFMKKVAISE